MGHPRLITIEQEWQGLWNNIKGEEVEGGNFYVQMRRSFYAGFFALQQQQLVMASPQVPEKEACRQLDKLMFEMGEFRKQLVKEVGEWYASRN